MGFVRAAAGVFLLCAAALAEPPATLRLDKAGAGVEILKRDSATPDSKGVIVKYALDVPEFEAGADWLVPREDWYNGANLMRPRTFRQIAGLPDGGFFLLLKLKGGGYLAVLPLAGPVTMAWLA